MNFASTEELALLTKREAADKLRVSSRTLDRYLAKRILTPIRLSPRATRVLESEVEAIRSAARDAALAAGADQ